MASIKVLVGEIDGVELEEATERTLDSEDAAFSAPGFNATNAKDAIKEAKESPQGIARLALTCGFGGNASATRWMEFSSSAPSNASPYVAPEAATLKAISASCAANATFTMSWYKNGTLVASKSVTNARTGYVAGLAIPVAAGDTLSAAVSSGSCSKPITTAQLVVQ